MHSVICIKQVPDPAQIRVQVLSNTIVQQGVPTNCHAPVAAEIVVSSVIRRQARSTCSLRARIQPSTDRGSATPWEPNVRCCSASPSLSAPRRHPRRTHARPRSERSGKCLLGSLSSSSASRRSTATRPRSAPGSQRSRVYCSSTTSPEPPASISASAAFDAERREYRPPRRRPWVRTASNRRTRPPGPCSTDSRSQSSIVSRRRVDRKENAKP